MLSGGVEKSGCCNTNVGSHHIKNLQTRSITAQNKAHDCLDWSWNVGDLDLYQTDNTDISGVNVSFLLITDTHTAAAQVKLTY